MGMKQTWVATDLADSRLNTAAILTLL